MLESGSSAPFFKLMWESDLLEHLFPCLVLFLQGPHGERVLKFLEAADELHNNYYRMPMDRAILACCLVYPILEQELKRQYLDKDKIPHFGEILMLTNSVIYGIVTSSFSHFPRKISTLMGYILSLQYRLTPLNERRIHASRLFKTKEFSLALRFLKIRGKVDPELMDLYNHWKEQFLQISHQERHKHSFPHHRPPVSS